MLTHALGTVEVLGLPAAIEAADVACKSADVNLIGYEATDGMGMVTVKVEGQVSAVMSAIAAARVAAARVTRVFATSVIPRPSGQLEPVVLTCATVGLDRTDPGVAARDLAEDRVGDEKPVGRAADGSAPSDHDGPPATSVVVHRADQAQGTAASGDAKASVPETDQDNTATPPTAPTAGRSSRKATSRSTRH